MNSKIGIIGPESDATVLRLYNKVIEHGCQPILIDSSTYPQKTTIALSENGQTICGHDISDINSWIIRKHFLSMPVYELEKGEYELAKDWRRHYIASREQYSVFASWLRILDLQGKFIMNPVSSFDFHYLKAYQLEIYRQHGFPIPKTLISNNAKEVIEFIESTPRVIYKPAAGGAYTEEITRAELTDERLESLKNSPVIFQELIDGENIRVNIVGDKVISAAGIKTESLDYRGREEEYYPVELSPEIERMCIEAMHSNNMQYSGVDLIRRGEQYFLLECNPSPVFLGIENMLKVSITDAIIDLAKQNLA